VTENSAAFSGSKDEGFMILVDKPTGYSSAKVVSIIKHNLHEKKAGHSGTLDPTATGLMIVCTGRKTKSLNELIDSTKEYSGVFVVGGKTKSFDTETEVYGNTSIEGIDEQMIRETAKSFVGEIEQIPPMYSAVKFKGKPLYKYARKNKEVERFPRKVTISKFEILETKLPDVAFRISCSKGTYIRTIASDFGDKLGVGAYLKELRRTRIGEYDVKDSLQLNEFFTKPEEPQAQKED